MASNPSSDSKPDLVRPTAATDSVSFPSVEEVANIASQSDPLITNLQITQSYFEISRQLALRTGPVANWCTFATWASKQAGATIRHEDVVRTFERLLGESSAIVEAIEHVSELLARMGTKRDASRIEAVIHESLSPKAAFENASRFIFAGNEPPGERRW